MAKLEKAICVFGDSIAYGASDKNSGWVQYLRKFADNMKDTCFVYNLSVDGDNTQNLLQRFEAETKHRTEEKDAIIIFAIGINDSQIRGLKNRVSLRVFENNIKKLAALATNITNKVVFVGLTPVDNRKTCPLPYDKHKSYRNDEVKKYNEMLRNVCKYNDIHFVEIYDKFMKANHKRLLEDGLHPNTKGHQKIFKIVKDYCVAKKII
jgi:lysophospholipase L1-like esterase